MVTEMASSAVLIANSLALIRCERNYPEGALTFHETDDMALVRDILTQPKLWRRMVDDSAPDPEHFKPSLRDNLVYVLGRYQGRVVALFVLVMGRHEAEVHFAMVPEAWGRERTVRIGREFLDWAWQTTGVDRLIGPLPSHNRLGLRLAKACGFKEFAVKKEAVIKNGRAFDLVLTEAKRPV